MDTVQYHTEVHPAVIRKRKIAKTKQELSGNAFNPESLPENSNCLEHKDAVSWCAGNKVLWGLNAGSPLLVRI